MFGKAQIYLRAEIEYHDVGIWQHQHTYIRSLLKCFGMENCSPLSTLMCSCIPLTADMGEQGADIKLYQSLIGG